MMGIVIAMVTTEEIAENNAHDEMKENHGIQGKHSNPKVSSITRWDLGS